MRTSYCYILQEADKAIFKESYLAAAGGLFAFCLLALNERKRETSIRREYEDS